MRITRACMAVVALVACARFDSAADEATESPDAAVGAEGGVLDDAGNDADSGTAAVCPQGARLCDNFERPVTGPLKGPWSFEYGNDGGLRLDDTVSNSPKTSLLIDEPGTQEVNYALGFDLPDQPPSVEVALSIRTDGTSFAQHHLVTVIFEENHFAQLFVRGGKLFLLEQINPTVVYEEHEVVSVETGAFRRYVLVVENAQKRKRVALRVEAGNEIGSFPLTATHAPISKVLVGAPYIKQGPTPKVWLDDIAITTP